MDEIRFTIERDEETGLLTAYWDQPGGGGITTNGADLAELEHSIREAVGVHFDPGEEPSRIRLHFETDPVLSAA